MNTPNNFIGNIEIRIYQNKPWRSQSGVSGAAALFQWIKK